MSDQTELISLYDYLGKAAGKELGGKVYQFANITGAKTGTKVISYSLHQKGRVMTYERHFLDQFFACQSLFTSSSSILDTLATISIQ
jgi:hypothetical protein